ncbi:hypothetical protein ACS0TY_017326 [Phlomoides rotata]
MEVISSSSLVILFSSLIFLVLLSKLLKKEKNPENLPPSPPGLPVIGHLHHLGGGLVHHAMTRINKKYGPVVALKLGEVMTVVISSRETTKEALRTKDPACADRPDSGVLEIMFYNYSDIAFGAYSEYWRQMRKICILEMLSAKNVKSFGYIRAEEMDLLVKSVKSSAGEAVNFTELIFMMTCSVTCRATFGKVLKGRETFIKLLKKMATMAGGYELTDLFPSIKILNLVSRNKSKLLSMRDEMDAILDPAVEEHRLNKSGEFEGEDIVDVLLRMQKNKELQFPITTDNIKAVILDMFTAGTETSATTTDWTMALLMKNPGVMAKLQSEIRESLKGKKSVEEKDVQQLKYLKLVVKESLRLHPPFPLLPRKCREECTVGGYTIPNKAKVMVNVGSLCRDPLYWNEPDAFQPERFDNSSIDFLGNDYEYLPFGSGKRNCPGLNFGIANVEFPLAQLLFHFDWKLPQGMAPADVDLTEQEGQPIARKNPLILIPTLHHPSSN